MGLAKSTYYFEIGKQDVVALRNTEVVKTIQDIFTQHQERYGVRRIYRTLRSLGYTINHKRVQRLMHQMGLAGKRLKAKYRSYQGHVGAIANNVIQRNFKTTAPLQKWTTDISQFNFSWGKCYLLYFRHELEKHGIIQSISRKGNCCDNSMMESFFGRMKTEMYYGCEGIYTSFAQFSSAVKTIFIITIRNVFNRKQNGCHQ